MFWAQLTTPDPDAAASFYAALFGWTVDMDARGPGLPRGAFFPPDSASGAPVHSVAGLEPMSTWQQQQGEPARWTPFLHTPDAVAMTERAQFHGATLVEPAMPRSGSGWQAIMEDPTGAPFGVWEPEIGSARGSTDASPSARPGTICWAELQTPDAYVSRDFYTELLVWSCRDNNANPDFLGDDITFSRQNTRIARVREVGRADPPQWLLGFAVPAIEPAIDAVQAAGGSLQRPPVEDEWPTSAQVTDPQGTSFLLIDAESREL